MITKDVEMESEEEVVPQKLCYIEAEEVLPRIEEMGTKLVEL